MRRLSSSLGRMKDNLLLRIRLTIGLRRSRRSLQRTRLLLKQMQEIEETEPNPNPASLLLPRELLGTRLELRARASLWAWLRESEEESLLAMQELEKGLENSLNSLLGRSSSK